MPEINWGLAQPHDIGGSFVNALVQGQQLRAQREERNALLQMRQQQAQEHQQELVSKQQEQRRATLPVMVKMLRFAKQGPAQYAQVLAEAPKYGLDVSRAPQGFDPAWIDEQLGLAQAMSDPVKMEALSAAGKAAADILGPDKVGTPEFHDLTKQIWQSSNAQTYVVGGDTHVRIPQLGGAGQVLGSELPPGFTIDQGGPAAAPQTPFDQAFRPFQTP